MTDIPSFLGLPKFNCIDEQSWKKGYLRGGLEDRKVLIDFNFGFEALIQYVNNVVDFTNSNREFWGTYC